MSKVTKWFKEHWEGSRRTLGYYFWIGVPVLSLFFSMLGWGFNWKMVVPTHFIGLFLVIKYDWFVKEGK